MIMLTINDWYVKIYTYNQEMAQPEIRITSDPVLLVQQSVSKTSQSLLRQYAGRTLTVYVCLSTSFYVAPLYLVVFKKEQDQSGCLNLDYKE